MSTMGAAKAFAVTMTTGTTATSAFDLGGSYGKVLVGIPTMTSGCDHYFQAAEASDGTFRRIYHAADVATATPAVVIFDSAVSNCYVQIPFYGRFGKIEVSTAASDTSHTYQVLCTPN